MNFKQTGNKKVQKNKFFQKFDKIFLPKTQKKIWEVGL